MGYRVTYDPTLPPATIDALQRLPTTVDGLVVTPYAAAEAPITLTAWGVLQRCEAVTAEDVAAFRDAHAREPGH